MTHTSNGLAARNSKGYHIFSDYRLLDAGSLDGGTGERLEQWGPYRLRRPDPRATGARALPATEWRQVDASFEGDAGRGHWERHTDVPERWTIAHGGLALVVKLAPFKHTGVFPEQAEHWRWMVRTATRPLHVLNLFAYTGGATMALARAGHKVTHVDASKPALAWARENAAVNDLAADAVRWIQDDAATFVRRELRRGRRYDAALMDPPAFGHAPRGAGRGGGEARGSRVWRVEDQLAPLLADTLAVLSNPVFLLINHYARDADPRALGALLEDAWSDRATSDTSAGRMGSGRLEAGRLRLRTSTGAALETGVYVRWRAAGD